MTRRGDLRMAWVPALAMLLGVMGASRAAARPMPQKVPNIVLTDDSEVLNEALRSKRPPTDVAVHVAAYNLPDDDPSKVRVLVVGEVDEQQEQAGRASVAYALFDERGERVVDVLRRTVLPKTASGTLGFSDVATVGPGRYRLRIAALRNGRVGTAEQQIVAGLRSVAAVQLGDLLVGQVPGDAALTSVPAGRRVGGSRIVVTLPLGCDQVPAGIAMTLDILKGAPGQGAVMSVPLSVQPGAGRIRIAQVVVDASLLPSGDYRAELRVKSGATDVAALSAAFSLDRESTASGEAAGVAVAAPSAAFQLSDVLDPSVLGPFLDDLAERAPASSRTAIDEARTGRFDDALARVSSKDPTDPTGPFLHGLALFSRKQLQPASDAFRETLRAAPDFFVGAFYIGACYAAGGKDKEAVSAWKMSLISLDRFPVVYRLTAEAMGRMGEKDAALDILDEALSQWPDNRDMRLRFAKAALDAYRYDRVFEAVDAGLKSTPVDAELLFVGMRAIFVEVTSDAAPGQLSERLARLKRYRDQYVAAGGTEQPLVNEWVAAVEKKTAGKEPTRTDASDLSPPLIPTVTSSSNVAQDRPQQVIFDLQVPGGVAGLLTAAGTRGNADPAVALLALIRLAYGPDESSLANALKYLDSAATRAASHTDTIPLPLSPFTWTRTILQRDVADASLLRAILADRSAAYLYYGLMALDDETLAFCASHNVLLSHLAENAGAFAQWGRSIHIRQGRVQVPGGPDSAALWEAVAGARPDRAEAFVEGLMARGGRPAFFFDTVAHLDPVHLAFVLGTGPVPDRRDRFRALFQCFARSDAVAVINGWPVVQRSANPATILFEVGVRDGGVMAQPSLLAFWEAALRGVPAACRSVSAGSRNADAAWIVERIEREPPERRQQVLDAVTFAQRVLGNVGRAEMPEACEVVASFQHKQALLLTLEQIGFSRPADIMRIVRQADTRWDGADSTRAATCTAQVQGILAILERAVSSRMLDGAEARSLVLSLVRATDPARTPGEPGALTSAQRAHETALVRPGAIGNWMKQTLLPVICRGQPSPDSCLARAVAGQGTPGDADRVVAWEDEHYRIDLGAATIVRLQQVRARQSANSIDDALSVLDVAAALGEPTGNARQAADRLRQTALQLTRDCVRLFGHDIPGVKASLDAVVNRLQAAPNALERGDILEQLLETGDALLADALGSFAYAIAIGDPDDSALLVGDPALRHWFDSNIGPAVGPWEMPEEVQLPDRSWVVEGALLNLYTVYPRSWLYRLSAEEPGAGPRLEPSDVRGFGETAAAFNAFALTDAGRDAIVQAIGRGRALVASIVDDPVQLWQKAAEVGVSEWRRRAVQWTAQTDRARALTFFSLSELLWLGEPDMQQASLDAWGVTSRAIDGALSLRLPRGHSWEDFEGPRGVGLLSTQVADVHLRLAEVLSDLKLPAVLAPGVAARAAWDVMTAADMAYPDDWLAMVGAVQRLSEDAVIDYVSALTAVGPLVPVGGETEANRCALDPRLASLTVGT